MREEPNIICVHVRAKATGGGSGAASTMPGVWKAYPCSIGSFLLWVAPPYERAAPASMLAGKRAIARRKEVRAQIWTRVRQARGRTRKTGVKGNAASRTAGAVGRAQSPLASGRERPLLCISWLLAYGAAGGDGGWTVILPTDWRTTHDTKTHTRWHNRHRPGETQLIKETQFPAGGD